MKKYNIGIIGITGAVGAEMLSCLEKLKIPVGELRLGASPRSVGKVIKTYLGEIKIQEPNEDFLEGLHYVLLAAGGAISKQIAPLATQLGVRVIDNSSAFRYDAKVPLVIDTINEQSIGNANLIANPNCTTAIGAMALYPIHKKFTIKKIIMSTYQATSGAGAEGMKELEKSTKKYLKVAASGTPKEKDERQVFQHNIAFNVIPHIDNFQENRYTKEEMKVVWELHKIFSNTNIDISCTAVRIPIFRAHSESITIETEDDINAEEVRNILSQTSGVEVVDDTENNSYPMPITASGKYCVEVGRIRQSLVFGNKGIDFFVSGDQLLRGAALNAVEILQACIEG